MLVTLLSQGVKQEITTFKGDKCRSLYLAYCLSELLQLYKYVAWRFFTAPSGTTVKSFNTVEG